MCCFLLCSCCHIFKKSKADDEQVVVWEEDESSKDEREAEEREAEELGAGELEAGEPEAGERGRPREIEEGRVRKEVKRIEAREAEVRERNTREEEKRVRSESRARAEQRARERTTQQYRVEEGERDCARDSCSRSTEADLVKNRDAVVPVHQPTLNAYSPRQTPHSLRTVDRRLKYDSRSDASDDAEEKYDYNLRLYEEMQSCCYSQTQRTFQSIARHSPTPSVSTETDENSDCDLQDPGGYTQYSFDFVVDVERDVEYVQELSDSNFHSS